MQIHKSQIGKRSRDQLGADFEIFRDKNPELFDEEKKRLAKLRKFSNQSTILTTDGYKNRNYGKKTQSPPVDSISHV